jgi:hypothetical protein
MYRLEDDEDRKAEGIGIELFFYYLVPSGVEGIELDYMLITKLTRISPTR